MDVSRGYREEIEYTGQPYDEAKYELVRDRWDHYHCKVCDFRINAGYTYWENASGMLVCDVCHGYIQTVVRPQRESS